MICLLFILIWICSSYFSSYFFHAALDCTISEFRLQTELHWVNTPLRTVLMVITELGIPPVRFEVLFAMLNSWVETLNMLKPHYSRCIKTT